MCKVCVKKYGHKAILEGLICIFMLLKKRRLGAGSFIFRWWQAGAKSKKHQIRRCQGRMQVSPWVGDVGLIKYGETDSAQIRFASGTPFDPRVR